MSRKSALFLFSLVVLYLLSTGVRFFFPVEEKPHKNQVDEVIKWEGADVEFSYLEYGAHHSTVPVVINSDPFNDLSLLDPFAKKLSENRRVIIPIYPVRDANGELLSHSSGSRAAMLKTFFEKHSVDRLDLAGHGFGNPVSIKYLEYSDKNHVRSYAMLSAMGVQEFHFLGYHVLNQPIYSLLYPFVWIMEYGLPIANWGRFSEIDTEGVRYLNSLDQRPYREILSGIEIPVLIAHSKKDRHVSYSTAEEHYRIIPQSKLESFDGDHYSILENSEKWSDAYERFLQKVSSGNATAASGADAERVEMAQNSFEFGDIPPVHGWGFILVILLLSAVTFVSEDLGCIGCGLLAAGNVIPLWIAFLVVYLGILVVDTGIYWAGRVLGRPVIEKAPFKWIIRKRDIDWSESLFKTNGVKIIFISRFVPGSRLPTYFTAGILKTPFSFFLLYFIISITIWTPLLLGTSIVVGQQMLEYLQVYQEYAVEIFFGLVFLLYIAFKYLVPLATRKGRRELAVKIIRMKQRISGEK